MVVKEFAREADYLREKEVYQSLLAYAPTLCPEVIAFSDAEKRLILPYLSSGTALEALEKAEKEENVAKGISVFSQVLVWLTEFYGHQNTKACPWVMGDINLRNFLWTGQEIVGIDFEGSRIGEPSEEVIQLVAFYLLYEPVESPFKASVVDSLIDQILRMTNRSARSFWEAVDEEIKKICDRREGRINR